MSYPESFSGSDDLQPSMQVFQDAWNSTDLPTGGWVTVGNYDGIHRGQRAIIERTVAAAREHGCPAILVTFDPHPLEITRPGEKPPLLTTSVQKAEMVAACGIEAMLVVRFDREMAERSAEDFVSDLLVRRMRIRGIVVGSSFRLGRGREGDVALLQALGREAGFEAHGVDEVSYRGDVVSSSRIRLAISEGKVHEAAGMLGRPYELEGKVVRGDRMGQRLGWPTVNLGADNELFPRDGVYATRIEFETFATKLDSVTNIGTRPTVYENYQRVVESHVLDFNSEVYGQGVRLRFYKRLRDEMIFPSIMDLSAQIGRDVEATREYFASRRRLEELSAGPSSVDAKS
ncbi:MAG: bifunctional riboflavin kinase/FAD synthetase [Thermoanaerobaculia bacterium]|nr:bifunctional riboflavin kinase/FAD synthetase [Thermoanaerobaculia bacterium]